MLAEGVVMVDDEPLKTKPEKGNRGLLSVFAARRDRAAKRRVLKSRSESSAEPLPSVPVKTCKRPTLPVEPPRPEPEQSRTFDCPLCGASVENGASACPDCGSRLITGITDSQMSELEEAEHSADDETPSEPENDLSAMEPPGVRFDAETGTVSRLPRGEPVECGNCGTEIEFEADRCPMCGSKLAKEGGIVDLFTGMDFDSDDSLEVDCPSCGEHVALEEGVCPQCKEKVRSAEDEKGSERIDPVIHMDNVVFLHLDVSAGEVNFLHRHAKSRGLEQITVQLEDTQRSESDGGGKDASRE